MESVEGDRHKFLVPNSCHDVTELAQKCRATGQTLSSTSLERRTHIQPCGQNRSSPHAASPAGLLGHD